MSIQKGSRVVVSGGENHYRGSTGTVKHVDDSPTKYDYLVKLDRVEYSIFFLSGDLMLLPNQ